MTILICDGHNLFHRARSGFTMGDYPVIFNFFRGFRALVEEFNPTRVILTLEGKPVDRLAAFPEYKANRYVEEDTPEHEALKKFFKQKDLIVDLLKKHYPVSVVRHPRFEADDVIFNLIRRSPKSSEFVVVSTDSDFTQLLNAFDNVKLYNPVKKKHVTWPKEVDYVTFKALKGDASDNIPGVTGVGEVTAMKLAHDSALEELGKFALALPDNGRQIINNAKLIQFQVWTDEEAMEMTSSQPTRDWDAVKTQFEAWEFKSMTGDKAWDKTLKTFDHLFGSDQNVE